MTSSRALVRIGSGPEIPRVVLGGGGNGRTLDDGWIDVVRAAIDAGFFAIDTAPLYGFGRLESLLGRALVGVRDRVVLLGKVGVRWNGDHGDVLFEATIDGTRRAVRKDSRPAALRRDVEGSLRRLGVDCLDVVQIHHPDRHVPIADAIGALVELRDEGKLRWIGVSNFDDAQLDAACAASDAVVSHQLPLSLLRQQALAGSIAHAKGRGVGVLAYAPLHRGLLAGHGLTTPLGEHDPRRWSPDFSSANLARVEPPLRGVLFPIASRHDVPPAAIAMAWALAQPGVDAIVAGLSARAQLDTAIAASKVRLSADELGALGDAFAAIELDPSAATAKRLRLRDRLWRLRTRLLG